MSELAKAYEPQPVESKWYQHWLDEKFFVADPTRVSATRPAYSIVIPPPNVTGVLTMGHVLNNTIQDILARKARMDGKEVLWLPGTDHAGIATQNVVEKTMKKAGEIKHRNDLGREALVAKIWDWKEKYGGIILQQLKALGASCDWTRTRFTMDPEYSRCVQKVFVDLYKKGLIYRGKRMVNWCPASLTALSDEEVTMKEQKGFMYHFKVEVAETSSGSSRGNEAHTNGERGTGNGEQGKSLITSAATKEGEKAFGPVTDAEGRTWLTIATTRPETIPGDTAVAVNSKDPRYAHLIGKHIVRPLPSELPREQRLIPIIGDEHVDFEFGTGVLKVTPAHDKADFEIGQRHKLPVVEVIEADGKMNALAGQDLDGLDRFAARKLAVEKLTELGSLEKQEPYTNNVGYSERADVPIEPRLSEQWFLKYPSVEQSRKCVEQPDASDKTVSIVHATGKEIPGKSIYELRKAALAYARQHHFIGVPFKNEDSGIQIRVGRQSLSHAFSNLGAANIHAVAVLPELIRTAVWLSSAPHEPANPQVKLVHRFVAALSLAGELYRVLITAKEYWDGTVLYDHKAKKMASGGKSLEAHPREGKLDTQPAPNAGVRVGKLLEGVNVTKMRFFPDRWAKVYEHWMGGIQDWCISRQLWWGHRIPVWSRRVTFSANNWDKGLDYAGWLGWEGEFLSKVLPTSTARAVNVDSGHINLNLDDSPLSNQTYDVFIATTDEAAAKILDQHGFTQDPDVLDTWFSSWLWPFATMGWTGDKLQDSKNQSLKAFYPTTDLVTGPDIIFFWVARMIMAGYEYMGDLPFRNVYFTGIIRDKQGRKMSKSLGNSPDPLDLIAKYGADALRFGVMRAAPLGQDILFDEQNVELGRNFCNKLWNACRFRQMQGQGAAGVPPAGATSDGSQTFRQDAGNTFPVQGEIDVSKLRSDDKWILLKLHAAIKELDTAFAEYRFSDATQTLYRFFYSEYCDWYVESCKAVLPRHATDASTPSPLNGERAGVRGEDGQNAGASEKNSPPHPSPLPPVGRGGEGEEARKAAAAANVVAVMDFVLSHTLRLFHPFVPFITEELWHGMGYAADMPDAQGGKSIMHAPWPKPFDADFRDHYSLDDCYLDFVNAKFDLVSKGRNLRAEARIAANKKVKFIFKADRDLPPNDIEVIKLLLNAETLEINPEYVPGKNVSSVKAEMGELYLPLEGHVDVAGETVRLAKELEKIVVEITKVEQKLANPSFAQKVPPEVLTEHRKRLEDWIAKRDHVQKSLDGLKG